MPGQRLGSLNIEPLNLAATADAGNLIAGQTYISGTRLRGALLTWLSARAPEVADELAARMSVSNGYFVPEPPDEPPDGMDLNGVQVLPAPLSLKERKGGSAPDTTAPAQAIPWWVQAPCRMRLLRGPDKHPTVRDEVAYPVPRGDQAKEEPTGPYWEARKPVAEWKRIKTEEYLVRWGDGQPWWRTKPKMGILMRNRVPSQRRDNEPRKLRTDDAGLFAENVLWEGQLFLAELMFADRAVAERFRQAAATLLAGGDGSSWLRLGRGGRPVRVVRYAWVTDRPTPAAPTDVLTITLTSDLIARTPWLTFLDDLDQENLRRLIAEALGGSPLNLPDVSLKSFGVETVPIYGFNTATGMPRAPALAIRRGSVFQLGSSHAAKWREALYAVLAGRGALGERTADGFGRFALDLDLHQKAFWQMPRTDDRPPKPPLPKPWRERVLEQVIAFQGEVASLRKSSGSGKEWPSVSQWQWVRTRAIAARRDEDRDKLLQELAERGNRLGAGSKWSVLAGKLRNAVDNLEIGAAPSRLEAQKYFLDQLARAEVALLRQARKRGEESQ